MARNATSKGKTTVKTKPRKAGRPLDPAAMHAITTLRMRPEELDLFQRAAKLDCRPMAQWMRVRLVEIARRELGEVEP